MTSPRSRYASDSVGEDLSYALRLRNRGFDEEQIARELASGKRAPGSAVYAALLRRQGRERADAYALRTARKAIEIVRRDPPVRGRLEGLVLLADLRAKADSLPWKACASPRLRRALEACFLVGNRVCSVKFGLAIREHSLLAGIGFEETRACRTRLGEMGWLLRDPLDRPGRTSRFRLALPPSYPMSDPSPNGPGRTPPTPPRDTSLPHSPASGVSGVNVAGGRGTGEGERGDVNVEEEDRRVEVVGDEGGLEEGETDEELREELRGAGLAGGPPGWLGHDAFREGALGDDGWYVLHAASHPLTVGQGAACTGYSRDEFGARADHLCDLGLMQARGGGRFCRAPSLMRRLDEVARSFGTDGLGAADAERYERQRAVFRSGTFDGVEKT